jgi:Family of unknown function (DUF5681)
MKEYKDEPQTPDESDTYEVGYGNPPKEYRFKTGQSGNPRGRKKHARSRKAIVSMVANELHGASIEGMPDKISTLELVLLTLRDKAMKGNVSAFRSVQKLLDQYGPDETEQSYGVLLVPTPLSEREWIAQARKKNAELARQRAETAQSRAAETQTADGNDVGDSQRWPDETITPGRLDDFRPKSWARVIR